MKTGKNVLSAQKNRLGETVLLVPTTYVLVEKRGKIIFQDALLSGGLKIQHNFQTNTFAEPLKSLISILTT